MVKKIILSLFIIGLIIFGVRYYNSHKTVECWWGVMYPTLSYVGFEDEENDYESKVSSSEIHYIPTIKEEKEEPVKVKIAIIEWLNSIFRKEN